MKKLNKNGFTLVELLAVIVILALLIVIVANTAIPAMNNAKKKSLQTYAQKVVQKAKENCAAEKMSGVNDSCKDKAGKATSCCGDATTGISDLTVIMGEDAGSTFTIDTANPIKVTYDGTIAKVASGKIKDNSNNTATITNNSVSLS